ncbi:MAG: PrsW family intramembrane metalloprotease [Anaerolineae bacterium]|jgi:RsiW-degrading membrane proteinase PrsW (M82 family)|nr:PrsW family intramembrane metalloprotease [Anaerolineae bacterium]
MPQLPASLARSVAVSPLRRKPVAIAFLAIMALLLVAGLVGYGLWLSQQPSSAPSVFIRALLAATGLALPALGFIWWLDRRERETVPVFFGVFLFGMVVSMGLALLVAGPAGNGLLQSLGLTPADARSFDPLGQSAMPLSRIGSDEILKIAFSRGAVPLVFEELFKLIAILLIIVFLRGEFDSLRDGVVYGALVGLGFLVAEAAFFMTDSFLRTGSLAFGQQLAARFYFLGLNGHTLFAALMGAGFGLARQTSSRFMKVAAPVAFALLALAAHLINNTITIGVAGMLSVLLGLVNVPLAQMPTSGLWLCMATAALLTLGLFYVALAEVLRESGRWERQVIRAELAGEVGTAITRDEYELLKAEGAWELRQAPGFDRRTGRTIVNAQNELALRKWRVRHEGGDPEADAIVAAWRADIAALRRETTV